MLRYDHAQHLGWVWGTPDLVYLNFYPVFRPPSTPRYVLLFSSHRMD